MIFVRLLCLVAGIFILVAPPVVLYPTGGAMPDALKAGAMLAGLVLASSGFFLIGMTGHRMRRSPALRSLAGLLLAAPLLAGLAVMWRGGSEFMLWGCSLMLMLTVVLYMTFVVPVVSAQGHRRLRARETCEPHF
ncbi:hypothetical protein [Massilia sp. DD77]|uniref:hypothetical protein n=1 Tax=Massilia sp. DD77 TaxID=3109349 RepID=UPI002FFE6CEF